MRKWRYGSFVLSALAALGFAASCASFGADEQPPGDAGEEASSEASADAPGDAPAPGDGGLPKTGPFCVSGGPYDYCWDFSDSDIGTNFDGLNTSGDFTIRQDAKELTSSPGSLYSEVRPADGGAQSAARCIQRLGPPQYAGVYQLAFSMRLACDVAGPSRPTIAELYCTDSVKTRRPFMFVEVANATTLQLKTAHTPDGTAFDDTGSVKVPIDASTWLRIEIDTTMGTAGGAVLRVNGVEKGRIADVKVGCVGYTGLELLLGAQGRLPGACAVNLDDVTLTTP